MVDRAAAVDVPAAQRLIDDARRWLNARGIDQWQDPVPDTVLLRDVGRGCLFVVRQDHDPGLRRFYEQQGFRHVRDVTVTALDGGRRLASSLYERALVR
jgi:GNAT superfamily N-acetyltransferase